MEYRKPACKLVKNGKKTMRTQDVRITFGMIVLNGEPFMRYNLRALYRFAHQIIVVEGACHTAVNIATPDGHSKDGTLDTIRRFQNEEDPEKKVLLVTAEDAGHTDGFWEEKTEMSQAYARRATGNYLWQVDSDEFYLPQDMELIIGVLRRDPEITMVGFRTLTFWGSIDCVVDGPYLMDVVGEFRRIFAWDSSYTYVTHRPPTVHDSQGRDLKSIKHVTAEETARLGILMYHYSLLLPKQVTEKCEYYSKAQWNNQGEGANRWARECFFDLKHPFRLHSVYSSLSWLDKFVGTHPPEVVNMVQAVQSGKHENVAMRDTEDMERLLSSWSYRVAKYVLRSAFTFWSAVKRKDEAFRSAVKKTPIWRVLAPCRGVIMGKRND